MEVGIVVPLLDLETQSEKLSTLPKVTLWPAQTHIPEVQVKCHFHLTVHPNSSVLFTEVKYTNTYGEFCLFFIFFPLSYYFLYTYMSIYNIYEQVIYNIYEQSIYVKRK